MKICYSGFNLYNQIQSSNNLVIEDFKDFEYATVNNVIFGHTFVVLHSTRKICLQGSICKDILIENEENVIRIVCVDNSIYILYENGKLYKIDLTTNNTKIISSFINVENPDDQGDYITDIACGSKINVAVTRKNKIFNIPSELEYSGGKIKQIVVGREHCLILNHNGDVFSFGCGIRGQLGHGTLENHIHPQQIEALAGVKIIKIAAGGWHSCVLSVTGDVYTWGWNSNGQLAVSNKDNVSLYATPQPAYLKEDPDCVIDDIACGTKHTIVLIGSLLYGAGWNKYNQLGKGNEENIKEFKLLKDFSGEKIIALECGPWSSAVIKE